MYADRYTGDTRFHPGGLVAAIGINAGVVAALLVAAPYVARMPERPPLTATTIDLIPPPPLDPPPPAPQPRTDARPSPPRPDAPVPIVDPPIIRDGPIVTIDAVPSSVGNGSGGGTGTGVVVDPPAPPLPVIVAPGLDPRYAADLQPDYPPAERRMGNTGKVTVRVLIGTDGRVQQVERVGATSDAFFRATEAQALRRWRFRPGTRDGVAQAAWRVMTVTFVMES